MDVVSLYQDLNGLTGPSGRATAESWLTRDAYRHALGDPPAIGAPSWFSQTSPVYYQEWVATYGAPVISGHGAVGTDNFGAVDWAAGNSGGWLKYHRDLIAEANAPAYTGPQYFSSAPAGYVPPAPAPAPAPAPVIAPPSPLPSAGLAPVVGPTGSKAPGSVDVPRSGYVTPPAAYVDAPAYVDASGGIVVDGSQGVVAPSFAVAPPPWGKLALIAGAVALLMRRR